VTGMQALQRTLDKLGRYLIGGESHERERTISSTT
jgi:hypothetical protein